MSLVRDSVSTLLACLAKLARARSTPHLFTQIPPFSGTLLCWFVQVSAVDAKHASADYDRFDCLVRDSWDVVKDHLRVNVRVWKRLTAEQQTRHLLNKSSPPLEQGQAEELAQEINELLRISEWHMLLEGGGFVRPRSCLCAWCWPRVAWGGGWWCVDLAMALRSDFAVLVFSLVCDV